MSTGPIFLSASVPYRRPEVYRLDAVAVREAVRALVAETVATRPLVFGGHPAISPLVWEAAESLRAAHNVFIYQSEMFRTAVPREALFFSFMDRLIWTPAILKSPPDPSSPFDQDASLAMMRDAMIVRREVPPGVPPLLPFDAGVFIGGMEGVEKEWELFRLNYPSAPALPIGSTEGAARVILDDPQRTLHLPQSTRAMLANDLRYRALFRHILP